MRDVRPSTSSCSLLSSVNQNEWACCRHGSARAQRWLFCRRECVRRRNGSAQTRRRRYVLLISDMRRNIQTLCVHLLLFVHRLHKVDVCDGVGLRGCASAFAAAAPFLGWRSVFDIELFVVDSCRSECARSRNSSGRARRCRYVLLLSRTRTNICSQCVHLSFFVHMSHVRDVCDSVGVCGGSLAFAAGARRIFVNYCRLRVLQSFGVHPGDTQLSLVLLALLTLFAFA